MNITKLSENKFQVTIQNTQFTVTLTDQYHQSLTSNHTKEQLIQASFKFLLDNEPLNAILTEFNLDIIKQYFPQYQKEITKYL